MDELLSISMNSLCVVLEIAEKSTSTTDNTGKKHVQLASETRSLYEKNAIDTKNINTYKKLENKNNKNTYIPLKKTLVRGIFEKIMWSW